MFALWNISYDLAFPLINHQPIFKYSKLLVTHSIHLHMIHDDNPLPLCSFPEAVELRVLNQLNCGVNGQLSTSTDNLKHH